MSTITNCVFSNPVTFNGNPPSDSKEVFSFSTQDCNVSHSSSTPTNTPVSMIGYNPTTTISSSTDIKIYGSFSAGEIIISILLLMIFTVKVAELLAKSLSSVNIKKKFLGYNGGDVEIREDN